MSQSINPDVYFFHIEFEFDIVKAVQAGLYEEYETFFQLSDKNSIYTLSIESEQEGLYCESFNMFIKDKNGRVDNNWDLKENEVLELVEKLESNELEYFDYSYAETDSDPDEMQFHDTIDAFV